MPVILKSASKLVFLSIALAACVGLFVGRISQENFMLLASGTFAFYFTHKGEANSQETFNGK